MIGIAESLQDGVSGEISHEMNHQLDMIIHSGKRLSNLVNDILDFSKLKHDTLTVNIKEVDFSRLIDIVFIICQPLLQNKEVTLINNISPNATIVLADEDRLQQIMYNLIGNSIKYTEFGEVIVSTEQMESSVKISVRD